MGAVVRAGGRLVGLAVVALAVLHGPPLLARQAADPMPALTAPVNDFAGVIDGPSAREMDGLSRALQAATGDALVVVTIETAASRGDIQAYANELFQNQGRGIGTKGTDTGLLILLAVKDRKVWVEVGYGLEGIITDGFAGQTSREEMTPRFRQGDYGGGLLAGMRRLAARIAEERGVQLDQLPLPSAARQQPEESGWPPLVVIAIVILFLLISSRGSKRRGRRRSHWGAGSWSGWSGGGYGGTFGGGGGFGGGGFGGFGGGSSGGGGGGSSW